MKFPWRLLTIDNLWSQFFKAKYLKAGHVATVCASLTTSRLWKNILQIFLKVYYEQMLVKIHEPLADERTFELRPQVSSPSKVKSPGYMGCKWVERRKIKGFGGREKIMDILSFGNETEG